MRFIWNIIISFLENRIFYKFISKNWVKFGFWKYNDIVVLMLIIKIIKIRKIGIKKFLN